MCPQCTQSVPWGGWGGLLPLGWASSTSSFSRNQQGSGHGASLEGLLCSRRASVLPGPLWGHGEGLGSNRSPAAASSGRASVPLQPSVLLPAPLTAGICLAARLGDPGLRCHSGHTSSPMSLMSCLGCRVALIRSALESSAEPEPFSLSFN